MKGKMKMASGGRNSRAETEKEAKSGTDGFNKGGAAKHKGKVHGKKHPPRHDKRDRKGKFAKGGAVFSEAHDTKQRPGYGEMHIDKEDE